MKQLVVCKDRKSFSKAKCLQYTTVKIKETKMDFALIESDDPVFDPLSDDNKSMVLIKISAFSSNFRDIGILMYYYNCFKASKTSEGNYCVFGSEFVGTVVAKGTNVAGLSIGDRVIPDNSYPHSPDKNIPAGVASNRSYSEYEILNYKKLIKVPETMPDSIAAGFAIGAQTVYSMIDKLKISKGNVLITGIKSNTSLFVLNSLKKYNLNVYGTSSNLKYEKELKALGLKKLLKVTNYDEVNYLDFPDVKQVMNEGGFDYVIDPFADVNMFKCLDVMAMEGKYVTCGIYEQCKITQQQITNNNFINVIVKNLSIMGNCLGNKAHLEEAISDFIKGDLTVKVAQTFTSKDNIKDFIKLSYAPKEKVLGKIVFSYDTV